MATPNNNLVTHREVQAQLWAALKWVIVIGLALVFSAGMQWAELRGDVTRALSTADQVEHTARQVDSLRIEFRHMSKQQDEMMRLLRER